MMYRVDEYMPRETATKWGRILKVAQDLGIVRSSEAAWHIDFVSQRWLDWPFEVHNLHLNRLHEINRAVHDTLRRQGDAATAEGKRAIEAVKQAIETQKIEEQRAQAAIRKLEAIQAQLREIKG